VEQREPYRLLELRITLDSHVSAGPELIEVCPLLCKQMLQAGVPAPVNAAATWSRNAAVDLRLDHP